MKVVLFKKTLTANKFFAYDVHLNDVDAHIFSVRLASDIKKILKNIIRLF
jgi:hypothetical protein